jgi:DNA transformation protein and related proteins
MFGGWGVYAEGLCFAIALKGEVSLKTDAGSQTIFSAAGSTPFIYVAKGRARPTSFWRLPAIAHEDADELRRWAHLGLEAARCAAAANARPRKQANSRAKAK